MRFVVDVGLVPRVPKKGVSNGCKRPQALSPLGFGDALAETGPPRAGELISCRSIQQFGTSSDLQSRLVFQGHCGYKINLCLLQTTSEMIKE